MSECNFSGFNLDENVDVFSLFLLLQARGKPCRPDSAAAHRVCCLAALPASVHGSSSKSS